MSLRTRARHGGKGYDKPLVIDGVDGSGRGTRRMCAGGQRKRRPRRPAPADDAACDPDLLAHSGPRGHAGAHPDPRSARTSRTDAARDSDLLALADAYARTRRGGRLHAHRPHVRHHRRRHVPRARGRRTARLGGGNRGREPARASSRRSAKRLCALVRGRRRRTDDRNRGRLRRSEPRVGSRRLSREVRPAAVHERQRLLHQDRPRPSGRRCSAIKAGGKKPRSIRRSRQRSVPSASSSSSRRRPIRPRRCWRQHARRSPTAPPSSATATA